FRELIHTDDAPHVLASEQDFAARLAEKILSPQAPARFRTQPGETLRQWRQFHDDIERSAFANETFGKTAVSIPTSGSSSKALTAVILHQNRPEFLEQCLESLSFQNFDFNVCVVDNASTQTSARAYIDFLERERTSLQVLRLPSPLHPSAARNAAAEALNTEWILWLDDDNLLKPNAVEKLMTAAAKSGAPFITAALDCFESRKSPLQNPLKVSYRTIFMGADPALGFFRNVFGDTASLMKRSAFLGLGGFHFESNCGNEDWEFFIRAALKGLDIGVLPEAAFWYRLSEDSRSQTLETYNSERFRRRPYDSMVSSGWLMGLLDLSFGNVATPAHGKLAHGDQRVGKELAAHIPVLGSVDDDLYQERVQRLGKLVFEAGPSTHFENIKELWHCRLDKRGTSMSVTALGFDPAIEIEAPHFESGVRLRLDAEIEVPQATQLQVFYKVSRHDNYDEKRSLLTPLRPGLQEVSIWLPETCIGGSLRIDPVCEQLNSRIESLRLYSLDEIELDDAKDLRATETNPIAQDFINDHPDTLFELHPTSEAPERSPES
ncbi:MAG: glycosyltransferase, partial [Bdellovibrionales bacterium]|nr:glycosyltransferase [Bdellovibrionales bacterium]